MATFPAGCTLLFGGSGGIGQGVARCFADAGSDVAVVYRSKPDKAKAVAAYAEAQGRKASVHAADVTDAAQVQDAIAAAIAEHGRIHTVVWGAGPLVNQRYLAETPMMEWRHAFDVEVHGFFAAAQSVIPHMREQGGGSFVTLGSAGHDWWPARDGMSVAVKAANEQLIKGIAKEEGRFGIRANSVLVGVIDAGQLHELTQQGQFDQAWVEETQKLLCLKRWGTAVEIGHACVYFASNEGGYTTGQSISVSGGFGV
ncbi:NAD(P)-dependent dehydrogenase (short-subunit alcohol dehydrogenase family) [Novosphingobium sp. PhB165]|uniref:SDR family NAD(P)-dependent oxidoreductase n=1 Tax=Novosphingobium sp. PhB165 TaxID=2485105 RepID=UPI0010508B42|nr:SDR family oxidoreductase [Novosphingobium sp. PhB165]TCM14662.1 NAD(P)-dependent dehydrogenase (short-subunit alcohol dehydrogenase family) [Novosphingobium sp. PhB165]